MSKTSIYYITILPQSQYTAKYIINDNKEIHTKRLEELLIFILSLFETPKKYYSIIEELIYSFTPFFIDIEKSEITELAPDLNQSFEEYKKSLKNPDVRSLKKKKPLTNLDKFKSLGNKNFFP